MTSLWRPVGFCAAVFVATIALAVIAAQYASGAERCPLGVCQGERVIVKDNQGRRIGTWENRGHGIVQFRDNQNRRQGHVDSTGRTYDANRNRTGTVGEPKSTAKPWWR